MSASDQMRAMLDQLMGTTRNGELMGKQTNIQHCPIFILNPVHQMQFKMGQFYLLYFHKFVLISVKNNCYNHENFIF